jgi:penicillin G amidase
MKPITIAILIAVISLLAVAPYRGRAIQTRDLRRQALGALARTEGRIKLEGLQKPVKVLRDEWGVAHIYAETQDDLFFAQGFVAAQDRLWQMDMWRRAGEGKLAEVLGPRAVERDRFARLIRYRGDMKAEYESYAPDARRIIEAFVRGVNAQIALSKDRLPVEFQLTGSKPEPWTPEVCLTRLAGYVMTRNASTEVLRARLAVEVGKDMVSELAGNDVPLKSAEEYGTAYGLDMVGKLIETDPPRKLELPDGFDWKDLRGIDDRILSAANDAGSPITFNPSDGSNNWVIDGTMSATGKPILANDPHRTIALPSLRYLVHLVGPGWNVIGAGEPALPGVAAGHNERVGFGFTIVGIDQQDLYVEEINPANPNEYRYRGKWEPMLVEREQIKVKGETRPREVELKFTAHGPVIYEVFRRAYALRWVGSEPGTAGYLASLTLNRVQNWKEFLKAMERWKVPSENLVYADVDGNVGWVAAGMAPIRKGWSGLLPVPGAEGKYEWQGFLPVSELPQSFNPSKHFIATANHNILPPGYKHELGYEWAEPIRFQRIYEVLNSAKGKFDVADFERLQHDEVSLPARELTAVLREAKGIKPELKPFVDMLTSWDCGLGKDSSAAALFEIWQTKLTAAVFKRSVPEAAWRSVAGSISLLKTIDALKNPSSLWFGSEDARAERDAALLTTLDEAAREARERLGDDPSKWRWGKLHVAPFTHALSTDDERRALFNLPSVERGGDGNTVLATGGPNFRQTHGASFREILDVSDWDRSVATNVPGQSGQPGSKHYGDLLRLWAEGKYFPLLYSEKKVEAMAKERLTLEPMR